MGVRVWAKDYPGTWACHCGGVIAMGTGLRLRVVNGRLPDPRLVVCLVCGDRFSLEVVTKGRADEVEVVP